MRFLLILVPAFLLTIVWASEAEATKPGYSCANVRCASGSQCIETPAGPVCQLQSLSCANLLCAQGNQCIETSSGPKCEPIYTPPPRLTCANMECVDGYACIEGASGPQCVPEYSTYPPLQSCAYGGYYHYGRLICHPAPAWRRPYQNGWDYYNRPYYPRPQPTPVPRPGTRPPWHPRGPDIIRPEQPQPEFCTMEYDPVCAEKPVVCVRSPCPADRRTFGNSCQARVAEYTILHKGTCR